MPSLSRHFPRLQNLNKNSYNAFLCLYNTPSSQTAQFLSVYSLTFAKTTHPVAETKIDSLQPNTLYTYAYVFNSSSSLTQDACTKALTQSQIFTFSTFEMALTPMNFTFGAGSCTDTGSTNLVFLNLTNEKLDFFLHMGDIHYQNIMNDSTEEFYEAYYAVFNSSTQKTFFQSTPILYIWDDHDFGPDNSRGTSDSRPAATTAYKKFVPYGTLKNYLPEDDSQAFPGVAPASETQVSNYTTYSPDGTYGIFRSFIVGRTLFIVMDLRSFKDVKEGDILGDEQKIWLENQFKFASVNDGIRLVFLVSTIFWIDDNSEGEWSSYPATQQLIGLWSEIYVTNIGKEMVGLSGDTHAMAFDDGRNNHNGGFPIIQAAPLDSFPICAGGPYSHGVEVDRGQYSIVEVIDDGVDTICVKIQLKRLGEALIRYDTCNPKMYPGTEGVMCPKIIVGESPGYGWVTIVVAVVMVVGAIGGFIAWYCLRRYRDKQVDDKAMELLEMTNTFERR